MFSIQYIIISNMYIYTPQYRSSIEVVSMIYPIAISIVYLFGPQAYQLQRISYQYIRGDTTDIPLQIGIVTYLNINNSHLYGLIYYTYLSIYINVISIVYHINWDVTYYQYIYISHMILPEKMIIPSPEVDREVVRLRQCVSTGAATEGLMKLTQNTRVNNG